MKTRRWLEHGALLTLGLVFAAAGILKVADPVGFADAVYRYRMLSWTPSLVLAVYLPWLELVASLALLSAQLRRPAVALLAGLCVVFLVVQGLAKARGLELTCGCFGGSGGGGGDLGWSILRDLALLALALAYLGSTARTGARR